MDIRSALAARNHADLKDVWIQILLAIPFTLLGVGFANGLCLLFLGSLSAFGISTPLVPAFLVFNALLAVALVIDVKRRPEESWFVPRYYQSDGSVKSHEFGDGRGDPYSTYFWEREKGVFGGMPVMTNISDPHNLGQRGRAISSGFANLILGGPRSLAGALSQRRRIAMRSQRQVVSSAEAFVAWLSSAGPQPEPVVKKYLEAHPDQARGLALAREIDVVSRFRNPVEFHYHVR